MKRREKQQLGKLPPMYKFILNPHTETRVSMCPICGQRMRQRKVPLFIHIDPNVPLILGYTCRYCPTDDLLVVNQDELESLLAAMFSQRDPSVIGNDYLVMGTVERKMWREGMKEPRTTTELLENLHDFQEVLQLEYEPGGWYPNEDAVREPRPATKQTPRTRKQRQKRPRKRSKK